MRRYNEDAHVSLPEAGVWAVADGMGGHHAGDVASQAVVDGLTGINSTNSLSELIAQCRESMASVNAELFKEGVRRKAQIIGSTVVVMVASGTRGALLWAGDSRGYVLRSGKLALLSKDHSRVNEMIELGLLTPENAESHPEANVITRAIGVADAVDLDVVMFEIEVGDVYLLCSDGLTRYVTEEEIARYLSMHSCQAATEGLMAATLATSARDNVTVVILQARESDDSQTVLNVDRISAADDIDDDPTLLDTGDD